VIKALYDADLLPRTICGSSVGSIICCIMASRKFEDIPDWFAPGKLMIQPLIKPKFSSYWEMVRLFVCQEAILDIQQLI